MGAKTEDPTPRRLRKARDEGDSGASATLAAAAGFLVAVAFVEVTLRDVAGRASSLVRGAIAQSSRAEPRVDVDAFELAGQLLGPVVPLLLAVSLTSAVVLSIQTGGAISTKKLVPSLERFDVVRGLRGLVSAPRMFTVVRATLTASIVLWLASRALTNHAVDLARVAGRVGAIAPLATALSSRIARDAALVGILFGVFDWLVTRRFWIRRLRMSKDEVKREHREAEGNPEMKAARERAHHEVLAAVMLDNVRKATVVIVNPTHLACALRYDADDGAEGGAPTVVASGRGEMAARILRAASESGVPVVRDVPLARALIELTVGESIPEVLYEAVAEILRDADEAGTL